ncbi:MAG: SGNH/GDSL hydrolase family protein [bacterium]|nr:SGNH/GDSL hydrolase family protein [bacterium]
MKIDLRNISLVAGVNLLVFAGLFLGLEAGLRLWQCESFACNRGEIFIRYYPGEGHGQLHAGFIPDSELGWRLNPDFKPPTLDSPGFFWGQDYRVNREGFRNTEDFADAAREAGPPRIMLLGDSFVFGSGIRQSATLARILERRLDGRFRVYSAGVSGWGIDQMLLAYQKYAPILRPEIVFLVFIDDDFQRALHAFRADAGARPMLRVSGGELKRETRQGPPLLERIARRSLVLNRLYLNLWIYPEERRLHRAIFSELIRRTQADGRRLLVMRYPEYEHLWAGGRRHRHDYSAFFRERSILYYDPFPEIKNLGMHIYYDFYQKDSHPTRLGNEMIGEYLMLSGFPQASRKIL